MHKTLTDPLHIEIVGINGSGKSTVIYKLLSMMKVKQLPVYNFEAMEQAVIKEFESSVQLKTLRKLLPNKYWDKVIQKYWTHFLIQYYHNNKELNHNIQEKELVMFMKPFFHSDKAYTGNIYFKELFSKYKLILPKFDNVDYILIDSNFVFRGIDLITLHSLTDKKVSNKTKQFIVDFITIIPLPQIVIFINTSVVKCNIRMQNRESGLHFTFKNLNEQQRFNALHFLNKCYDIAITCLQQRGAYIIKINNDGLADGLDTKLEKTVDEIMSLIESKKHDKILEMTNKSK